MMILRNPKTGETVVTSNRDGYPGWRIVEQDVARPRGHSYREKKRWRIDKDKSRPPTVERLTVEVAELRARLDKLEGTKG